MDGASKLLNYFERQYKPESIITYADRRFSKGNLYYKLGFNLSHISKPNFIWLKSDYSLILNRLKCLKNNIKYLFNDYDEKLSVNENLLNHKFIKIYDCR